MTTRADLLRDAEALCNDVQDMLARVRIEIPDRVPTAESISADINRVRRLIAFSHLNGADLLLIAALLTSADDRARALMEPLQ